MKRYILIFVSLFIIFVSCQERPDKDISSNFIGTWILIKCIVIQKDGKISFPYGEKPMGQIVYDTKGNMSVVITNQEIKMFRSENPFQGTPDEIIPAFNGLMAYYGTYKIFADSNIIIHSIKASSFPNWVDEIRKDDMNLIIMN